MKKIASILTNPKRNLVKARFLMGTMLSAVVWGSVQATPLDKALVVAQAPPQSEQEDKKQAPQRPGQRQKQQEERREAPKPHRVRSLQAVRRNVRCSRHPHPVSSRQVVGRNVRCSRHPHRVSSRRVVRRNVRCSRHPTGRAAAGSSPRTSGATAPTGSAAAGSSARTSGAAAAHRVRSRRDVRRNVRCNRRTGRAASGPSAGTSGAAATFTRCAAAGTSAKRGAAGSARRRRSHRAATASRCATTAGRGAGDRSLGATATDPANWIPRQAQRAFVPPPAQDSARRLDDVRGARREVREGDRLMIQEPGRVIIREGGRTIIRHNEVDRFRWQARDVHIERRGADTVTVFARPDGSRIYTETDESGRLLRRYRRAPDGREVIIIDNRYSGPPRVGGYFIDLPPPVIRIPRERYIVDAQYARPDDIYGALWAAPVENIERPYTLDEIRYSPRLLERMPRVDLDTVTFDTGSWEVTPDQVERLAVVADGINRAIAANPSEVFLVEGHTDAVGSDVDNLSLSDRRAELVALVLSQQFGVPAENLTTQGYGEQYLKVPTQGPEQANRRVTVRRITPLLTGQNEAVPVAPR